MLSKYGIFCKVIELGSFTKAGRKLGYSQSAVSQTIKSMEKELGTILIDRKKDGMELTADGRQFYPYIQAVYQAEKTLEKKKLEMQGLSDSTIRIGTFTSVSRNLLPRLMKKFKEKYPKIHFILQQSEYTSIEKWVKDGSIDFGFVNLDAVSKVDGKLLYKDEMFAVLPKGHILAKEKEISLSQLSKETFILLDEGDYSVPMNAFQKQGLAPHIEYKVYDDYSILAMVKQGLGISILYQKVLEGFEEGLEIRPIKERPERPIALIWNKWETMSVASRKFVEFIMENMDDWRKRE
jgi:DNA-binding transcriptional LysR family regulator